MLDTVVQTRHTAMKVLAISGLVVALGASYLDFADTTRVACLAQSVDLVRSLILLIISL